ELRHPPGVHDIARGQQHAHLGVDRHDEAVVHLEQTVLDRARIDARTQLTCGVTLAIEPREEADALIQVVVVPLPLIAGHFHRQLRVAHVLDLDARLGSRNGHAHEERDWDHGPDDLELGAVIPGGGYRTLGTPELDDRVDHHAEDEHGDDDAYPENQHVQAVDFTTELGHADRHIHFPCCERRACG